MKKCHNDAKVEAAFQNSRLHKHEDALRLLKTSRGQINAVIKMIEDGRYCIDISTQLLAAISLLKKANTSIINKHIETCIRGAIEEGNVDEKLSEMEQIMKYIERTL